MAIPCKRFVSSLCSFISTFTFHYSENSPFVHPIILTIPLAFSPKALKSIFFYLDEIPLYPHHSLFLLALHLKFFGIKFIKSFFMNASEIIEIAEEIKKVIPKPLKILPVVSLKICPNNAKIIFHQSQAF
jgi:hypothetical protein